MNPEWIKTFQAVFKTGGFSSAGNKIHLSQPAVSRQIKLLEEELGVRLFERLGPLQVVPTTEGRKFEEMASPVLKELVLLKERFFETLGHGENGSLGIASQEAFLSSVLPEVIRRFRQKHPGLKIQLFRKDKAEITKAVLAGEVDFGVTTLEEPPLGTVLQIVAKYKRVLVLLKDDPLLIKKRVTVADIAKRAMILPPLESNTRQLVEKAFRRVGVTCNMALEVMGREAAKQYVMAGLGASIMSESYLNKADRSELGWRDVSKDFGYNNRAILSRKGKKFSDIQMEMIKLIKESEK